MKKWVVMMMAAALMALMVFATGASAAGILNFGKGSACSPIAGGSCQGSQAEVTQTGVNSIGNNNTVNQFSGRDSNNLLEQICFVCADV